MQSLKTKADSMCIPLPHPPTITGHSHGALGNPCPEVHHQDEPTEANPINAHKQMAGHKHPGSIKHWRSK